MRFTPVGAQRKPSSLISQFFPGFFLLVPPFGAPGPRGIQVFFPGLCQVIWDEVGEPDMARDRMLLELEQECLDVYRRKVDQANRCRAQLRQAIAEAEAELAGICSAMGEPPIHVRQVSFCALKYHIP